MRTIYFEIPEDVAQLLSDDPVALSRAALEAFVLEGIRSERIGPERGRALLGIASRYEMDGFLKAHEIYLPFTAEEIFLEAEVAASYIRS